MVDNRHRCHGDPSLDRVTGAIDHLTLMTVMTVPGLDPRIVAISTPERTRRDSSTSLRALIRKSILVQERRPERQADGRKDRCSSQKIKLHVRFSCLKTKRQSL